MTGFKLGAAVNTIAEQAGQQVSQEVYCGVMREPAIPKTSAVPEGSLV